VVALGATLVLGGLAGCGGGAVHVSSNMRLALRHLVAARAGVVSTQFLLSGPGEFVPPVLYVTRFDQAAKRAEVKVDLRPFMSLYELTLPPSSRIGKVKDWRFDAITDNSHGLVMYLASPLLEEPTFQGKLPRRLRHKPWIKVDLVDALLQGGSVGQVVGFLPSAASPVGYFKALSGHAARQKVERIDGVETNRYAETVDFRRHLDELPSFIQKLIVRGSPVLHAVVWVDASSTVRRIRLTSQPLRQAQGIVVTATIDFRDLGSKVSVGLPPAGQVFDAAQLGSG
jgi:hypothetical protein